MLANNGQSRNLVCLFIYIPQELLLFLPLLQILKWNLQPLTSPHTELEMRAHITISPATSGMEFCQRESHPSLMQPRWWGAKGFPSIILLSFFRKRVKLYLTIILRRKCFKFNPRTFFTVSRTFKALRKTYFHINFYKTAP